jgi:hypothetical protein
MQLRYLLPTVEIVTSIVFVVIPLWRYLPNYRPRGPDGVEIVCHDNCPPLPRVIGIDPVTFGRGVSLPAAPVVLLICSAKWDYSHDGHDYFHDPVWQGIGFALAGIVVWFFLGRLIECLISWRRTRTWQAFRAPDLIFALITAVVATIAANSLRGLREAQFSQISWLAAWAWIVFWDLLWLLVGYSAVMLGALRWVKNWNTAGNGL